LFGCWLKHFAANLGLVLLVVPVNLGSFLSEQGNLLVNEVIFGVLLLELLIDLGDHIFFLEHLDNQHLLLLLEQGVSELEPVQLLPQALIIVQDG